MPSLPYDFYAPLIFISAQSRLKICFGLSYYAFTYQKEAERPALAGLSAFIRLLAIVAIVVLIAAVALVVLIIAVILVAAVVLIAAVILVIAIILVILVAAIVLVIVLVVFVVLLVLVHVVDLRLLIFEFLLNSGIVCLVYVHAIHEKFHKEDILCC